jgi:hypothetical protein
MLLALGAVSSALDVLQSLTSPKPPSLQSTGFGQGATKPFDFLGNGPASGSATPPPWSGGKSQLSPATLGALLAAQGQLSMGSTTSALAGRPDALKDLFSKLDANGDGKISQKEFEDTLGAGGTNLAQADDVFQQAGSGWRRHGQPRRNVVGTERQWSPPCVLQCRGARDAAVPGTCRSRCASRLD